MLVGQATFRKWADPAFAFLPQPHLTHQISHSNVHRTAPILLLTVNCGLLTAVLVRRKLVLNVKMWRTKTASINNGLNH